MLPPINLLFLLSLGFISWIILCYFKEIENHFMEKPSKINVPTTGNVEPNPTVNKAIANEVPVPPPSTTVTCNTNSDIYVNFLCISVCIYVMIKLTMMAEHYICKYIRGKYHGHFGEQTNSETDIVHNAIIKEMRENQENLLIKMEALETQNHQLRQMVYGPECCDLNCKKLDEKTKSHVRSGSLQNIFISNRHFHLNRQVFVKDPNITATDETIDSPRKLNSSNQIWRKYLELQQKLSTDSINQTKAPTTQIASVTPVVMSADELKNLF